jgi:putative hydrolase of the HAD superfamily
MPKAILLDAVGTLIHPREPVGETYARIARSYGINREATALDQQFAAVFPALPKVVYSAHEPAQWEFAEKEWWCALVRAVLNEEFADFDLFFEEVWQYYDTAQAWRLYPEVSEILGQWKKQEVQLAVVSNFDKRLIHVLEGLNLDHFFSAIIHSSLAGAAKPEAKIFTLCLDLLGVKSYEVLHVGDSWQDDVVGALGAGLPVAWVKREGAQPDHLPLGVRCVTELAGIRL